MAFGNVTIISSKYDFWYLVSPNICIWYFLHDTCYTLVIIVALSVLALYDATWLAEPTKGYLVDAYSPCANEADIIKEIWILAAF